MSTWLLALVCHCVRYYRYSWEGRHSCFWSVFLIAAQRLSIAHQRICRWCAPSGVPSVHSQKTLRYVFCVLQLDLFSSFCTAVLRYCNKSSYSWRYLWLVAMWCLPLCPSRPTKEVFLLFSALFAVFSFFSCSVAGAYQQFVTDDAVL